MKTYNYVVVDEKGSILQAVQTPVEDYQTEDNDAFVVDTLPEKLSDAWFDRDADEVKGRVPMELSVDSNTISGIPVGSWYKVLKSGRVSGTLEDDTLTVNSDVPGEQVIIIIPPPPYLREEVTINE